MFSKCHQRLPADCIETKPVAPNNRNIYIMNVLNVNIIVYVLNKETVFQNLKIYVTESIFLPLQFLK